MKPWIIFPNVRDELKGYKTSKPSSFLSHNIMSRCIQGFIRGSRLLACRVNIVVVYYDLYFSLEKLLSCLDQQRRKFQIVEKMVVNDQLWSYCEPTVYRLSISCVFCLLCYKSKTSLILLLGPAKGHIKIKILTKNKFVCFFL